MGKYYVYTVNVGDIGEVELDSDKYSLVFEDKGTGVVNSLIYAFNQKINDAKVEEIERSLKEVEYILYPISYDISGKELDGEKYKEVTGKDSEGIEDFLNKENTYKIILYINEKGIVNKLKAVPNYLEHKLYEIKEGSAIMYTATDREFITKCVSELDLKNTISGYYKFKEAVSKEYAIKAFKDYEGINFKIIIKDVK